MIEVTNIYPNLSDQTKFRLNEINNINIETILIWKFKEEK